MANLLITGPWPLGQVALAACRPFPSLPSLDALDQWDQAKQQEDADQANQNALYHHAPYHDHAHADAQHQSTGGAQHHSADGFAAGFDQYGSAPHFPADHLFGAREDLEEVVPFFRVAETVFFF